MDFALLGGGITKKPIDFTINSFDSGIVVSLKDSKTQKTASNIAKERNWKHILIEPNSSSKYTGAQVLPSYDWEEEKSVEELFKVKVIKINTLLTSDGRKKAYVKLSNETPAIDIATQLGLM